jgi:hypothetical protein
LIRAERKNRSEVIFYNKAQTVADGAALKKSGGGGIFWKVVFEGKMALAQSLRALPSQAAKFVERRMAASGAARL